MKFPVDKCFVCGLDLTTAEPAEVRSPDKGIATGTCPGCGRTYLLVGVSPEPEAEAGVAESEAEAEAEPEAEAEAPETEAEPEPEPEE